MITIILFCVILTSFSLLVNTFFIIRIYNKLCIKSKEEYHVSSDLSSKKEITRKPEYIEIDAEVIKPRIESVDKANIKSSVEEKEIKTNVDKLRKLRRGQ